MERSADSRAELKVFRAREDLVGDRISPEGKLGLLNGELEKSARIRPGVEEVFAALETGRDIGLRGNIGRETGV